MPNTPAPITYPAIEAARREIIAGVFSRDAVSACWPTWKPVIRSHLGSSPTAEMVLALGSSLSEIFLSTRGAGGREQSQVSGAGSAWEGLACYYLNLCLVGSPSIVFSRRSQVPEAIRDALTVLYRSVPANTESDMVALTFPPEAGALTRPLAARESIATRLDSVTGDYFRELRVAVIQCKTNWNDNAQIPMLWDMIYNTRSFRDGRTVVGINSRHLSELASFAYAFVTVPTNGWERYRPHMLSVRRVNELSGGNYWGRPTASGIARSAREIFAGARIGPGDGTSIRRSLEAAVSELQSTYAYFDL